jgi:hypothetical protein
VVEVVGGVRHANANAASASITNAHSNITRRDARPDRPMVMSSTNVDSNIARPDANVHPASVNIDTAMRHSYSSCGVANMATVQEGLQQQ